VTAAARTRLQGGPARPSLRTAAALAGWLVTLTAVGATLVHLGRGPLALPPVASGIGPLRQWTARRDAPTIVMAGFRALALGLDAYLLMTTVLGAAARTLRCLAGVRLLDRLTPPAVQRLLSAALGGVMLSAPMIVPLPGPSSGTPAAVSPAPTLRRLLPQPPPRLMPEPPAHAPSPSGGAAARPSTRAGPPKPVVVAGPARPPDLAPLEPPNVWVVGPGDNLWDIARSRLEQRDGGPVTAATIVPYWHVLIEDNRDRAPDPNLIYDGQLLRVPPP